MTERANAGEGGLVGRDREYKVNGTQTTRQQRATMLVLPASWLEMNPIPRAQFQNTLYTKLLRPIVHIKAKYFANVRE